MKSMKQNLAGKTAKKPAPAMARPKRLRVVDGKSMNPATGKPVPIIQEVPQPKQRAEKPLTLGDELRKIARNLETREVYISELPAGIEKFLKYETGDLGIRLKAWVQMGFPNMELKQEFYINHHGEPDFALLEKKEKELRTFVKNHPAYKDLLEFCKAEKLKTTTLLTLDENYFLLKITISWW